MLDCIVVLLGVKYNMSVVSLQYCCLNTINTSNYKAGAVHSHLHGYTLDYPNPVSCVVIMWTSCICSCCCVANNYFMTAALLQCTTTNVKMIHVQLGVALWRKVRCHAFPLTGIVSTTSASDVAMWTVPTLFLMPFIYLFILSLPPLPMKASSCKLSIASFLHSYCFDFINSFEEN